MIQKKIKGEREKERVGGRARSRQKRGGRRGAKEDVKEDGEWSMDCNGVSLTGGHTREPVLQTPLVITRVAATVSIVPELVQSPRVARCNENEATRRRRAS